ncbi:DUF883 family protein, partial [Xenorhabdus bovienii]
MAQKRNSDDLRAELQSIADTLEEVLNNSGDKSKAELEKLRSKAEKTLKEARVTLSDASDRLVDQT